jgi:predicted transcriptional regulator
MQPSQNDSHPRGRRNQTSISLPPDLQFALTQAAKAEDRTKSWITAQALRQYLARGEAKNDVGGN